MVHTRFKTFLLLILVAFSSTICFSQSIKDTITKAENLAKAKKYESAFNLLNKTDPLNRNLQIVLLKEDIAINDYVTTVNFEMFAFRDLKPGESAKDFRKKPAVADLHVFKIDKVLDSFLKIYPDSAPINKGLGDFYFKAHERYGDKWAIKEPVMYSKIENAYTMAEYGKRGDFQTCYRLGLVYVLDNNYPEGIKWLQKSVVLNDTSADAHYNLAYAFMNNNDTDGALNNALAAEVLYKDSTEKGDAARMAGVLYGTKGDKKKALEYMELSDDINPGNYNTLKILVDMNLKLDNKKKSRVATELLYDLGPGKSNTYNDLYNIYMDNKQPRQLIGFFEGKIKASNGDFVELGYLYFCTGRLYGSVDKSKAIEDLTKSAEVFAKVYKPDNPVFQQIYATMKEIK